MYYTARDTKKKTENFKQNQQPNDMYVVMTRKAKQHKSTYPPPPILSYHKNLFQFFMYHNWFILFIIFFKAKFRILNFYLETCML